MLPCLPPVFNFNLNEISNLTTATDNIAYKQKQQHWNFGERETGERKTAHREERKI